MNSDSPESIEKLSKKRPRLSRKMTMKEVIDLGEYRPEFLSTFPEWYTLSAHIQFQYIRQALDNRRRHLITQWAEINNVLDFHLKPELKQGLKNIEKQLKILEEDRERLYIEYSGKY
jgi:hypothetical protein